MDTNNNNNNEFLMSFLGKCGILCQDVASLNNHPFPREVLLNDEKYDIIKNDIPTLKKLFSSSYMTSLQTTAEKNQRWPLINIVRQVLKRLDFKLTPVRHCDGYNKERKKKYKRMFLIEKINNIDNYVFSNNLTL